MWITFIDQLYKPFFIWIPHSPITLTLPFLLSPLTFFRLPFLHLFFLRVTLKLNPLSSQNPTCNRSGVDFSIFKYSAYFTRCSFFGISLGLSAILCPYINILFFLISSELVLHLILFLWIPLSMLLISALSIFPNPILILEGLSLWLLIIFLYIYLGLFGDFSSSFHLLDFLDCLGFPSDTSKILYLLSKPKTQRFSIAVSRRWAII